MVTFQSGTQKAALMNFKRREWIHLAAAALCGCKERKAAPVANPPATEDRFPFTVEIPPAWIASSRSEKVPARPVYSPEELEQVRRDEQNGNAPTAYKPGYFNRPQHWAIRLPAATPEGIPANLEDPGDDPTAAQILIHKADEWGAIMADGVKGQDESPEFLRTFRRKMDEAADGGDDLVSPAYMDAFTGFRCLKKRIDFQGGHGTRMLAQWMFDTDLVRKGRLHYVFLGLSDDDSCQIIATFPVDLPGLPGDELEAEHLGHSTERYEALNRQFADYERDAVAWLEQRAAEITPSLDVLDNLIRSLVVRHWE
jgi:hypothetical protein